MFIVFLVLAAALSFIGYQFFTFYKGISSTKSVYQKDLDRLSAILSEKTLAPWEKDELDILSRVGESNVERSLFGDIEQGVLYSIYHEPIMAFATKVYSADNHKIMLMRINADNYGFISDEDQWSVSKNNQEIGKIKAGNGVEFTSQNDKLLIDNTSNSELIPVIYNDTHVVSINSDDKIKQSRVINPIKEMNDRAEELFLIGLGFAIIDNQI